MTLNDSYAVKSHAFKKIERHAKKLTENYTIYS